MIGGLSAVAFHRVRRNGYGCSCTLADRLGGDVEALGRYLGAGITRLKVRVFADPFGNIDRFAAVRDRLARR